MRDSVAMGMFVAGLVLTLLGAGGIEASMDAVGLAQGLLVAVYVFIILPFG